MLLEEDTVVDIEWRRIKGKPKSRVHAFRREGRKLFGPLCDCSNNHSVPGELGVEHDTNRCLRCITNVGDILGREADVTGIRQRFADSL